MADGEKSVKFAASGGIPKPKRTKRDTIINLAEFAGLKPKAKPVFTEEQMGRGATFNVSDFDPDEAGEGALTDFERNIYNKLRPIARQNGTPSSNQHSPFSLGLGLYLSPGLYPSLTFTPARDNSRPLALALRPRPNTRPTLMWLIGTSR